MFQRRNVYTSPIGPSKATGMVGSVLVAGTLVAHIRMVKGPVDSMAVEAQIGNGHYTVHGRSDGRQTPPARYPTLHWRMEVHGTVLEPWYRIG